MSATLDAIRSRFPKRATLTPDEVAEVIHGNSDRATVQGVREALSRGLIVPGLRKLGGRWLVPIGPLSTALDGLAEPESAHVPARATRHTIVVGSPQTKRRGRVPDAVRLGKIRAWSEEVLRELDELDRLRNLAASGDFAKRLGEILPDAPPGKGHTPL
jgi:hypothetical protein